MNDQDRHQGINNQEDLSLLWQRSGMGAWAFVKANRALRDAVANKATLHDPQSYRTYERTDA